jgi:hypothetical protein
VLTLSFRLHFGFRYQGKVATFQVDGTVAQLGIEFEGGDVQFMELPDDDVRLLTPSYGTFVINGRTLVSAPPPSLPSTKPARAAN